MHCGLVMFPADYAMRPEDFARAAEERGFESIFLPEHTHIPASRQTPWPGGGDLPEEYWHTHDPFVALAAAASVTEKIRLGTGICLLIERDPITTAKEVASLDFLSNGRVIFGIGGGWNVEEMANHGTDSKKRWKLLRESVLAMKEIWTEEEAEFHGELVDFDKIWSYPKPVQKPHPPILLGSATARGRQRVVDYCDGWLPIGLQVQNLKEAIDDLHARAREAGRNPSEISITVFGAPGKKDELERLAELGVERAVFWAPPKGRDEVLPVLDGYARLVGKV